MKLEYEVWQDELSGASRKTNWPCAIAGLVVFLVVCAVVWWRF